MRLSDHGSVVAPVRPPEVLENREIDAEMESEINAAAAGAVATGTKKRRPRTKIVDFEPWEGKKHQLLGLASAIAISRASANFSNFWNNETRMAALRAAIEKVFGPSALEKFSADCSARPLASREFFARFDQSCRGNGSVRMNAGYTLLFIILLC